MVIYVGYLFIACLEQHRNNPHGTASETHRLLRKINNVIALYCCLQHLNDHGAPSDSFVDGHNGCRSSIPGSTDVNNHVDLCSDFTVVDNHQCKAPVLRANERCTSQAQSRC